MNDCRRTFEFQGTTYKAKEQQFLRMKCLNVVQDICRDCILFQDKKCAAWKIVNGKVKMGGSLLSCPKKIIKEQ